MKKKWRHSKFRAKVKRFLVPCLAATMLPVNPALAQAAPVVQAKSAVETPDVAVLNAGQNVVDRFADIKSDDWWVKAVQYVCDNGIMAGVSDTSFCPANNLSREQFTQVLYNHSGKPAVSVANPYSDVDESGWYRKSVLWAKENNIANGIGDGTQFGVGQNITREALALMLYKYAKLNNLDLTANANATASYADASNISSWAKDAMNWAVTKGIMSGKGTGKNKSAYKLDPQGNATRAECASMMRKLLDPDAGKSTDTDYVLEDLYIIVDGTVTATVDNGQDAFMEQWEEAVSKKLGHSVRLHINQIFNSKKSSYSDTVSRFLSVGKPGDGFYPDALIMSPAMLEQYKSTGILWDMAAAYDNAEFQSRIILPSINENLKNSQGQLFGFSPCYGNGCVTYIKKSWLDAVGKTVDDIKTYDDYYALLKAFHDGDPDGNGKTGKTYGVVAAGFAKLDEYPYINYMPEFWQGAYPDFYQKDGKWVDGFEEQATIDALDRLAQAYKDGLIDPDTEDFSTKNAREKWFSNDQSDSSGVFTYWAGTWYKTLSDNLIKQDVKTDVVMLPPIQEIKDSCGGYLNRQAPVWVITDDGDGNDDREQAIFNALLETMLDGDKVQTLWTYGAEGVHWSTKAETFTLNAGTSREMTYTYTDGQFHLKPSPSDPNSLWKKNYLDPKLVIAPLSNGFTGLDPLEIAGNKFFTENCVDAPITASCSTLTKNRESLVADKTALMKQVVKGKQTGAQAIEEYKTKWGAVSAQILAELNAQ